ncbi:MULTISPECIES: haloacid dehalogenase type II [Paraburkholderia]|jgi:2-haloacid dehalogenase|uniref:2-haloacid dehalogenase n=1 Tax=Paraburkholderia aspalathi TaxID=1324617 RepID=A0A1I7EI54_9BURK|nr:MULTISPECIES: haloacid dehalogenase type II [Paraburkholderia]MCP2090328.1 2-haloacid dehalogenase [Paraburkholderia sediminicola]MBK3818907.1 haloacid dehalogenase type II [Paraburkholderia aspalathi]MBK3830825.1 haloacid dehalogenase type II [Paraburkholderia aspalathi]MBK3837994.1 haloacid dehalogenase type II [Paraburkholderia aspalathi]MBK3860462.1 haloacid dehalogenase type II [Paraburkholderia aspalathi]
MIDFEPKYITFDCYGTLTKFRMADMTREMFGHVLQGDDLEKLVTFYSGYRRDEVLGAWKPYRDVVVNALRRACKRMNVEFNEVEAEKIYTAVPTWGPHPDVPEGLSRLAKKYKLVILSNASNNQIQSNVDKLGAPFHAVFTAEQAQSYKPRMQGFEYMFDQLNCNPEDVLHVSSSLRYDLMTAHDLGIKHKAFVKRGHEPSTPYYQYYEVNDIPHLAAELGL